MFRTWVCLLLLVCLTLPVGSTPLVNELQEISMQFQVSLSEAEKALNDLAAQLTISETALGESKQELKALRAELMHLRIEVERLKKASEESVMQKQGLEQRLSSVKTRTDDLRNSFDDYKRKAERELRRKKTWRTIAVVEAIVIAAGVVFVALR